MDEARITINGNLLTQAQAMTLRIALRRFMMELTETGLQEGIGMELTTKHTNRAREITAMMQKKDEGRSFKTIWKYDLSPRTQVLLPPDAAVLTVQMQHGEPQMWVLLDPNAMCVRRTFVAYGTADDLPSSVYREHYCGTFERDGLVFHVFEETV